jgi:NDP-mannose synthase
MSYQAVILAGGLGTRLQPFTQVIPKPLLPVGESSVLEIQILSLKKAGIFEIFIATNYMSEYVEAFLGDGSKYGVSITFSKETRPLGTCGPLGLLREKLEGPFLLMNGDILTTLNFEYAFDFAQKTEADLVVVTKEITTPFNFGKVVAKGDFITDIEEKPDFKLEILSGIYILKPPVLEMVPIGEYFGIDTLIKEMIKRKKNVGRYLMKDYWLDIGRVDDYQTAQDAYKKYFYELKNHA